MTDGGVADDQEAADRVAGNQAADGQEARDEVTGGDVTAKRRLRSRPLVFVAAGVFALLASGVWVGARVLADDGPGAARTDTYDANPRLVETLAPDGTASWMDGQTPDDIMLLSVESPFTADVRQPWPVTALAIAAWGDADMRPVPNSEGLSTIEVVGADAVPAGADTRGYSLSAGMPSVGRATLGPVVLGLDDARLKAFDIPDPETVVDAWIVPSRDALVLERYPESGRLVEVWVAGKTVVEIPITDRGGVPSAVDPSRSGDYVTVVAGHPLDDEPLEFQIYGLDGSEVATGTSKTWPLFLGEGNAIATVELGDGVERAVVTSLLTGEHVYESAWVEAADYPRAEGISMSGDALIAVLCADGSACSIVHVEADGTAEVMYEGESLWWADVKGDSEHLIVAPVFDGPEYLLELGSEPVELGSYVYLPDHFDGSRMLVLNADGSLTVYRDGTTVTVAASSMDHGDLDTARWSDDGHLLWLTAYEGDREGAERSLGVIDTRTGEITWILDGASAASITNLTADGTGAVAWTCGAGDDSPCQRMIAWSSGEVEVVTDGLGNYYEEPMLVAFSPDESTLLFSVETTSADAATRDFDVMEYTIGSHAEAALLYEGAYLFKVSWYADQVHGVVTGPR